MAAERKKSGDSGGKTGGKAKKAKIPVRKGGKPGLDPFNLDRSVIAIPLIEELKGARRTQSFDVIIDLNLLFPGGADEARKLAMARLRRILGVPDGEQIQPGKVDTLKSSYTPQYLFARLTKAEILELAKRDAGTLRGAAPCSIYKIWPDFPVEAHLEKSVSTVKADAARISFSAVGHNITWAVIDTGIDGTHPHFATHGNLQLGSIVQHMDFTTSPAQNLGGVPDFLEDPSGHGTHVAGIIAGQMEAGEEPIYTVFRERDSAGDVSFKVGTWLEGIYGIAPRCKLVSLRVLDGQNQGKVSNLLAAIGYVQKVNDHGRLLRIHGVNLSVGYEFDAEWFACGQSPLCVEVDRLVRSGVAVVTAAGNTGYGFTQSTEGITKTGLDLTINDPGNAELAITVGATHREMPHIYGVSYFSSKGPTGDGRLKPDLVAPGEKILSCAAGAIREEIEKKARRAGADLPGCHFGEQSGTSMAAPHVSGAVAAFLSIRREFIGRPERVKEIFLDTATDLKRERYFQGHGLVDLMRAIQSV